MLSFFVLFSLFIYTPVTCIFLIIPEDVPTALVGIYGFAPKLVAGTDSRVGFGWRLGNHADFQVMYEFGPQEITRPIRTRSAPVQYRQSVRSVQIRRRPLIQFLIKAGFLRISRYDDNFDNEIFDEPR